MQRWRERASERERERARESERARGRESERDRVRPPSPLASPLLPPLPPPLVPPLSRDAEPPASAHHSLYTSVRSSATDMSWGHTFHPPTPYTLHHTPETRNPERSCPTFHAPTAVTLSPQLRSEPLTRKEEAKVVRGLSYEDFAWRGAARAEDALGTPTQSHISPGVQVGVEYRRRAPAHAAGHDPQGHPPTAVRDASERGERETRERGERERERREGEPRERQQVTSPHTLSPQLRLEALARARASLLEPLALEPLASTPDSATLPLSSGSQPVRQQQPSPQSGGVASPPSYSTDPLALHPRREGLGPRGLGGEAGLEGGGQQRESASERERARETGGAERSVRAAVGEAVYSSLRGDRESLC